MADDATTPTTYSVPQVAALLGVSPRAVRKHIAQGKYVTAREIEGLRGRCGRNWRIRADDPALPRTTPTPEPQKRPDLEVLKGESRMSLKPEDLSTDEAVVRVRAMTRAAAVPEGVRRGDWMSQIAREEGISRPTLYRWIAEGKAGKFRAARPTLPVVVQAEAGPLKVEVTSRVYTPQAVEFGLSLALQYPGMDTKEIYRRLSAEAASQGWEIGSLPSFYRLVAQLPAPVAAFASGGRRAAEALIKPPIFRDFSCYSVYEVLVGDQHIFDYAVTTEDGEVVRPQMFAWADFRSRYFSGIWPVMGPYDKHAVGFALREACRWGVPQSLYTDWGKPEGSGYVQSLRRQLAGFSACRDEDREGIPQKKAKPRNAQAKPIEGWFSQLERLLLNRGLPGYCRRNVDEKRNEFIAETLRKETKGQKLLPAQGFFEIVLATFEAWHDHVMAEEGIVPRTVFEEGIRLAPIPRFDDETLDFLFLPAEKRSVRNCMVSTSIAGHGRVTWYAPELSALCKRGRKAFVEVRYDPYDPAMAHVLDVETAERICTAERWTKIDPHDMGVVSDKIRRQNQLLKWWGQIYGTLRRSQEDRIRQFTPYVDAARASADVVDLRKGLVVDGDALDRKLVSLAEARAGAALALGR